MYISSYFSSLDDGSAQVDVALTGDILRVQGTIGEIERSLQTRILPHYSNKASKRDQERLVLRAVTDIYFPPSIRNEWISFTSLNMPICSTQFKSQYKKEKLDDYKAFMNGKLNTKSSKLEKFNLRMGEMLDSFSGEKVRMISHETSSSLSYSSTSTLATSILVGMGSITCGDNQTNYMSPPCNDKPPELIPEFRIVIEPYTDDVNNPKPLYPEPIVYALPSTNVFCTDYLSDAACTTPEPQNCQCRVKIPNIPYYTKVFQHLSHMYISYYFNTCCS